MSVRNLSRELFVSQRVSRNHVLQCFKEKCFGVATIESKGHFLKVGGQMFCRDFMPRTHNAALQQRESGFDAVGCDVSVNVNLRTMVYRLVLLSANSQVRQSLGIC